MKTKKRVVFNMLIRPDLKAALLRESKLRGRSMASLTEEAVEKVYCKKPKTK